MGVIENRIDRLLKSILNDSTLEDFLEEHDLTPTEVVSHLYNSGLIDLDEELEEFEISSGDGE